MDFSLNEDHLALVDAVRRYCDGEYPFERRGNAEGPEQRSARWAGLCSMGLLGLTFPAAQEGSEQGPVEVMLVARELGRCLGGGAFLPTVVICGKLIERLGSEAQRGEWLPAIARGLLQVSLAIEEPGRRYDWLSPETIAERTTDGFVLRGVKSLVLEGDSAGLFLVVAKVGDGGGDHLGLFAVNADAPGVRVKGFGTIDGRWAAEVTFDSVSVAPKNVLGPIGAVAHAIDEALDAGVAALCAEAVGAVEVLLEQTTDHLKTRRQFGAPLAKFQSLQHRVADMAIAFELLKSMACGAAMAMEQRDPVQRHRLVSAAKVFASQQGREQAFAAIQMHGAMGMTDECRISHYAKRLLAIGQLLGDAELHMQRFSKSSKRV